MSGESNVIQEPEELEEVDFSGALPKMEIQALELIDKYPQYDGRGVVIAIFDTGVDPGAHGLQITSDGKPKIVDIVDCTGSGDVDTSRIVRCDDQGLIISVLGKPLRPNPEWKNPSGDWHIGGKAAFDLYPAPLRNRMKQERRRRFDEQHRIAVAKAREELSAFESSDKRKSPEAQKQKEELEERVKLLEKAAEKYDDVGPWIDVVAWNDGDRWLVALDTSDIYSYAAAADDDDGGNEHENLTPNPKALGRLADFTPLTNYRDCLQYGELSKEDACNFAVNVYDAGKTVSIVVDAGSHGTHVAGIAAAYHPEDPSLNGVAPGAQIVSCKIGDTRLGSMETMTGLTRALIAVLDNKCDMINMSYGEATSNPNKGRFVRLAEEIVYKHDVIYIASAGNAGPALSTVGAPGGTSSAIMGIGAFVSPALATAAHSLRAAPSTGAQYTWSSRGPSADGAIGVSVSAPGGAIAPVPQWSRQRKQLMNGTSMASPCACGGIALIVSALKAKGRGGDVTPARIRRAVENTALPPDQDSATENTQEWVLTYGRGLLQVKDALEYLDHGAGSHFDDVLKDLRLDIHARRADGTALASGRGILIREPADSLKPTVWLVEVKPGLKDESDIKTARLEIDLKLRVQSTQSWVTSPSMLMLHHNGRTIEVHVDPTDLPEGVHYAEVQGIDVTAEWRGPLFRIPITVVKPLQLAVQPGNVLGGSNTYPTPRIQLGRFEFVPGKEVRRFVAVPVGATWAEMTVTCASAATPISYMLRATALRPATRCSETEHRAFVQLSPEQKNVIPFAVIGGTSLELTIAQFWSSLGEAALDVELSFHGVEVSGKHRGTAAGSLLLDGAGGPTKAFVRALLRREMIKPTAKLDTLRMSLRPTESEFHALNSPRDRLPGCRSIYRLVLTYSLPLSEGGKITPRLPALNNYVYDGEIESQMYFVCDSNKQVLAIGDIYPDAVELKKGTYTIRISLRHDDASLLDKMKNMSLLIDRKLDDKAAVSVPIYASAGDSLLGKDAIQSKERPLCPGETIAMFLGPVPEEKLPKDATHGRQLLGKLSLGQSSISKDAPASVELVYLPPPAIQGGGPKKQQDSTISTSSSTKISREEMVRDAEIKYLSNIQLATDSSEADPSSGLVSATYYEDLLAELLEKYPNHLPLLREPLQRLMARKNKDKDKDKKNMAGGDTDLSEVYLTPPSLLNSMLQAADRVLNSIDATELAVFLARKCPEEGEHAAERKKDMDDRKSAIIEALVAKCHALLELDEQRKLDQPTVVDETFQALQKWVDPAGEAAYAVLAAKYESRRGHHALALRALDKAINGEDGNTPSREVWEMKKDALKALGLGHLVIAEQARIRKAFPPCGFPPL